MSLNRRHNILHDIPVLLLQGSNRGEDSFRKLGAVAALVAEASLRDEPENEYIHAKVRYLKKKLKDLEEQAPWLVSGLLQEYSLWGVPH